MTARAHVAIRIAAVVWIAMMALLPRLNDRSMPQAPVAAKVVAPAPHAHAIASAHPTAALARR